jgi:hypothetical protein
VHCRTEAEAQEVQVAIAARMRECGLEPVLASYAFQILFAYQFEQVQSAGLYVIGVQDARLIAH